MHRDAGETKLRPHVYSQTVQPGQVGEAGFHKMRLGTTANGFPLRAGNERRCFTVSRYQQEGNKGAHRCLAQLK